MKVELTQKGLLIVTAETGMESYALSHWKENFQTGKKDSAFAVDVETFQFKTEGINDSQGS